MADSVFSWLDSLEPTERDSMFTFMRRIGAESDLAYGNQDARLYWKPVGSAHFDVIGPAEVRRAFLAALRAGAHPDSAADAAKQQARAIIASHNANRPSGADIMTFSWPRSDGFMDHVADFLLEQVHRVIRQ